MDDHSKFDPSADPQVQGLFKKLAYDTAPKGADDEVAPLFPGFQFDVKLVAGITPIESGGPLDFYIDRPNGMRGWIINLTVDGIGRVFDGPNSFTVEPGDLLLFPPEARHFYGRDFDADKWWHRWIYFQPRAFWKPWLDWHQVVDGVHILRKRDEAKTSELFRLFVEVEKWAKSPDNLSVDLAFNRLEHILLQCARMTRSSSMNTPTLDDRVLAACSLISANLDKPLSVKDIASHVCLSPSRLSHLFRKNIGTGVVQWRDGQRVQYAMQILRVTNVPIKSLSQMVGYEDPLYFSRVFRRHTGMSPRTFRDKSLHNITSNGTISPLPGDAIVQLPLRPD
ncbi:MULTISPECIES: arabinose operon transcriptional regulator AraC [Cohaesibacter]|uniref:arabinose operon transcriptional regulator AraC n=1 Tax=Cohaesibacter TaxID=655352 RepID=UPI000DE8F57A|nr:MULTISPECIES: arabinose operon transcriptional regulator AraC [Cohaesibacter]TLP44292.1 arabinose operon transcriptional regulator AraC [Cohaesibacter sp. CAU 1516]